MVCHKMSTAILGALVAIASGLAPAAALLGAPNEAVVSELAPGVYFRKAQTQPVFTGCNQGWIVMRDCVLVIDANFPGQADTVVAEIRKTTDKPIRFVFDTHYHGDHADGNVRFGELGALAISSERSRPLFESQGLEAFERSKTDKPEEYGKLEYQMPTLYFPDRLVLDDGTQRVELIYFGHAHTMGDAVAWLPRHGILFTGDACVNGAFNYTGDSDTASWIQVLSRMLELPVTTVAPGHGELGDKTLIETQQRYFVELRQSIERSVVNGYSLDEIKQKIDLPFYEQWTGVQVRMNVENIEHVFRELTAK